MAGRDTIARNSARKAAITAKKANDGVAPYGFGAQVESYTPKFTKLEGPPIFTAAMSGKSSIYWFRVIKVDGLIPNALGKYYATFSTNHNAREASDSLTRMIRKVRSRTTERYTLIPSWEIRPRRHS